METGAVASELTDLAAGIAAEHLVCADLLLQGYRAFRSDQHCAYDVIVDLGARLLRVQVKATRGLTVLRRTDRVYRRGPNKGLPQYVTAYMWHVRRAGKGGRRVYEGDAFDLLALVALDVRRVAYMPPSARKQTVHMRAVGTDGGKQFDNFGFQAAIRSFMESPK